MPKDKISDYSATANSNTDIGGVNIDEGCAPSGINDAIRTLMKQLKDFQQGTNSDSFNGPIGSVTPAAGAFTTLSASGVASFAAGSASAPALTRTGDTNTGIFFPAADTIAFTTNGTEDARFDSAGNLGLGVTPSAWNSDYRTLDVSLYGNLHGRISTPSMGLTSNAYRNSGGSWIYKNTSAAARYDQDSGFHIWYNAPSGTAGNAISFTQAMTLDASGNLGLGTTSPTSRLEVIGGEIRWGAGPSVGALSYTGGAPVVASIGANPLLFFTNATERARIDSSGNLLVGQTSRSQTTVGAYLAANGEASGCQSGSTNAATQWNTYSTGAAAFRFYVGMGGTVFATSTTITGISDQRLKENIRDLDDGLDKVMALKPRKFDWKENKGKGIANDRGFIAQEFETVFPDMIDEWKDPAPEGEEPYKAVNANLVPTLVKAIQEQQAMIDSQSVLITSLTERLTALENK